MLRAAQQAVPSRCMRYLPVPPWQSRPQGSRTARCSAALCAPNPATSLREPPRTGWPIWAAGTTCRGACRSTPVVCCWRRPPWRGWRWSWTWGRRRTLRLRRGARKMWRRRGAGDLRQAATGSLRWPLRPGVLSGGPRARRILGGCLQGRWYPDQRAPGLVDRQAHAPADHPAARGRAGPPAPGRVDPGPTVRAARPREAACLRLLLYGTGRPARVQGFQCQLSRRRSGKFAAGQPVCPR
mmetsp:Transcript_85482/g.228588  ORF Transcript_85482/g.228588 Transcript_85482/m.228588 type:complete len:240 (-) Transcript_85482:57-776(-)